jgi:kinetochore protein Nuf2
MSQYSFPLLPLREIRATLSELEIQVIDEDLANPMGNKVRLIYEQLIDVLLHMKREERLQPALNASEHLEYPELHEESVPTIAFVKACHKLLSTSGIFDFGMKDILQPEAKRLRRNLSAIINFAKFREDRQPGYVALTEQTENLDTQKSALEDNHEHLLRQFNDAKAKQQQEEPERQRIEEENVRRGDTVRTLFNQQTEVHNECQSLKQKLHAVQDAIRETDFKLCNANDECKKLKEQIVPDIRGLRNHLTALHEAEAAEKAAIRSLELKLTKGAEQREALERATRDVDEVLAVQAEVEAEQAKLRDVRKQLKEHSEAASRDDGSRNDEQLQIRGLLQRKQLAQEKIDHASTQHASKRSVAADAHADTRRRWSLLEHDRSEQGRMLESNESQVRELKDRLFRGQMEHKTEVESVLQQQQMLAAQVRAYHQDLVSAMKQVTSSNSALVVQ